MAYDSASLVAEYEELFRFSTSLVVIVIALFLAAAKMPSSNLFSRLVVGLEMPRFGSANSFTSKTFAKTGAKVYRLLLASVNACRYVCNVGNQLSDVFHLKQTTINNIL